MVEQPKIWFLKDKTGGKWRRRAGDTLFALNAGILSGFVPVYNYFLGNVDLLKTVAHRSLRSLVMPLGMVLQFFSTKNNFSVLYLPVFLSVNRTVYVYAVQSGYVACAALDYFIYPFFTVLLRIIILQERLGRWAWLANLFFTVAA